MKTHLLLSIVLAAMSLLSACGGGDGQESSDQSPTPPPTAEGACEQQSSQVNWAALMKEDCPRLSQYGLFNDPANPTAQPRAPGLSYQLATQLFSNYATKYRFIYLPAGQSMQYQAQDAFDLPVGTVLVKTFSLPLDTALSGSANETLIETRLLIHREQGWTSLVYTNGNKGKPNC